MILSLNNMFANLYEDYLVFDPIFSNKVFDAFDYQAVAFVIFLIPLITLLIFYRPIDPQPVKLWKWIVTFVFSLILVGAISYYWVSTNSMYNSIRNEDISEMGAVAYTFQLAGWSALLAIIPAFLYSILLSRTISINNSRNPF